MHEYRVETYTRKDGIWGNRLISINKTPEDNIEYQDKYYISSREETVRRGCFYSNKSKVMIPHNARVIEHQVRNEDGQYEDFDHTAECINNQ